MNPIDFQVGGLPVAQPRPRGRIAGARGKQFVHMYNPGDADEWKAAVALAGRIAFKAWAPLDNPLCLKLSFRMPRPESHYRTTKAMGRQLRMDAPVWQSTRPDFDNLAKAVADALTGICWVDDNQIVEAYVQKRYASESEPTGVRVVICKPVAEFMEPELFEGVANG